MMFYVINVDNCKYTCYSCPTMSSENKETKEKSLLGKILFIVGVVVILIILAFLVVTFVPRIFSGLANVGSSLGSLIGNNTIVITADKTNLQNNDKFTLVWDDDAAQIGSYNITYECVDNVYFDIITDSDVRRLICENTFTLGDVDNATLRIHFDEENAYADVPIYISYSDGDGKNKNGEIFVTVQNGTPTGFGTIGTSTETENPSDAEEGDNSNAEITTTEVTTNQNAQTVTSRAPQAPTPTQQRVVYQTVRQVSPADLAISNIVVLGNNQVQFTVSNIGGQSTGNWLFNYSAPTNNAQVATSPLQISLAPGQAIRYTLNYFVRDGGAQTVSIALDPSNQIGESNENNNLGVVTFSNGVPIGNNSGNNGGGTTNPPVTGNDDADFVIEDLEVGRLSGNRFIEDDTADEGDDIAIRFVVKNTGDRTTNNWRFEIEDLPFDDNDDEEFRSDRYNGLRPGEYTEVIASFDNIDNDGNFDIRVRVDTEDDTDEESESNNTDSVELRVRN